MDQERWRRLECLYYMVLEREPDQRIEFIAEACGGDEDLRREIHLLLSQSNSTQDLMGHRAWQVVAGMTENRDGITPGTRFGPYEIVGFLGEGGMGRVYQGLDTRLGRPVAIKISADAFSARFEREARAIAALNHPQICTLYDVGPNYLVMELVEGETLAQRVDRLGVLPVRNALEIGLQVAEALEAAHIKGIVHRDLKPANIKITPDGRVKVLDFGLAKAIGHGRAETNEAQVTLPGSLPSIGGHVVGTPAYMSPEQARGEDVDQRTDIWAFGCLLFELLSAKRAFPGEFARGVIVGTGASQPDWEILPAAVPVRIEQLLRGCLEYDASRRPHAMAKIIRNIHGLLLPPKHKRRWVAVGHLLPASRRSPLSRF